MADVRIDQNPKISDTVVIPIPTPDADDCFVSDPFRVDDVKIYFLSSLFVFVFEFYCSTLRDNALQIFDYSLKNP